MNLIKKILWIVVASWAAFFAQEVWAVGNDVMDGNILWACDFEAAQREESPLTVEGMKEHMLVSGCEADNESVICANGGIGNYFGNIPGLFETVGTNCLKVNTGTDPFCIAPYLVTDEGKFSARYAPPEGQSLYVDALMQFTVTPLADTVSGGASWSDSNSEAQNTGNASLLRVKDLSLQRIIRFSYCGLVADLDNKVMLYCQESEDLGSTNWCANVGIADGSGTVAGRSVKLAAANPDEILPAPNHGKWVRVTFRAVNDSSEHGLGFEIYINGILAAADGVSRFRAWPSALNRSGVAAIGFAGEGQVDNLVFTTLAPDFWNVKWVSDKDVTSDGNGSMRSGRIDDDSESWMEMNVSGSGSLSFKWKASTESYMGYVADYAYLSVDGKELGCLIDYQLDGVAIGGVTDWQDVTVPIEGEGVHTIRWTYVKDEWDEIEVEGDCVWVDEVSFKTAIKVDFDINGAYGDTPSAISGYNGSVVNLPNSSGFSNPKYSFVGWSNGIGTYPADSEYMLPSEDITLKAVWKANTLSVPVIESDDVENGGEIDAAYATIRIIAEDGASIYYTLDGTAPDTESLLYEGPFVADGMNVQIYAIAVKADHFDSAISQFSFTRKPYSLAECLNVASDSVTSGGDSQWTRVLGTAAHDGVAALKSGAIGDDGTSSVEMAVNGPGEISFWWKVSSEAFRTIKFDYVSFEIDGVEQSWHGGEVDWTNETFAVWGVETHVLKWTYRKNSSNAMGEDCAWLDEVVWTPVAFPELDASASSETVTIALNGAADAKLSENIKTVEEYSAFRYWAMGLSGSTLLQVKESPNAWLSYALDTDTLIEGEVTEDRLKVASFGQIGNNGLFLVKMRLEGVDIGDGATTENLLRIFAVEGAEKLEKAAFSVKNVVVYIVQPNEGMVAFIVAPRNKGASYFFRARMREDCNGDGENGVIENPWYSDGGLTEPGPYWGQILNPYFPDSGGDQEPGPYWSQIL